MEDQGKRLLIAAVLALGILLVWSVVFPPPEPTKKTDDETAEARDAGVGEATGDSVAAAAGTPAKPGETTTAGSAVSATPVIPRGEEKRHRIETDSVTAEFSTYGASLVSWKVHGYTDETGESMELVSYGNREDQRSFVVNFDEASTHRLPEKTEWQIVSADQTMIEFQLDPRFSNDLSVTKKFEIFPDEYRLKLTVLIEKRSVGDAKQSLELAVYGYQDPKTATSGGMTQIEKQWKSACRVDGSIKAYSAKKLAKAGLKRNIGAVDWVGMDHSYFLIAAAPKHDNAQITCSADDLADPIGAMVSTLGFPIVAVKQGEQFYREFEMFLGPKYLDRLEAIDADNSTKFASSVDLGTYLGFIARPMLWLLQRFQGIVFNYGIAIILLTIFVKLATLYWTTKSMRSMKEMGRLKPKIEAIQKKFKDDKQRQQTEIMAMYKAHGVNPLSGCLPMILQMPIWFALYRMLMKAAELYQQPFIPGWIDDLTATDPYYIMPIAVLIMMFVQAKMSPTQADSTQQKIMMYGLPLMFGFFSFMFPAGLVLYIFTNTTLTVFHHMWMNRTDPHTAPAKVQTKKDSEDLPEKAKSKRGKTGATDNDNGTGDIADNDSDTTAAETDDGKEKPSTAASKQSKKKRSGQKGKRGGKRR